MSGWSMLTLTLISVIGKLLPTGRNDQTPSGADLGIVDASGGPGSALRAGLEP